MHKMTKRAAELMLGMKHKFREVNDNDDDADDTVYALISKEFPYSSRNP